MLEGKLEYGVGASLSNLLGMGRSAALAGNLPEAYGYFNRVLEIDPRISEAWLGKGKAAGWQSTLVNMRLQEALVAFNHAIATADPEEQEEVTAVVIHEVNVLVSAMFGIAKDHIAKYVSLDDSWPTYVNQVAQLLATLEAIRLLDPLDRTTLENIVYLCRDNIEGVAYRDEFNNNVPALLTIGQGHENKLNAMMNAAILQLRALDPSYSAPEVQKKKAEACFIVTATMGDAEHPTVLLMRRFRDEWLRNKTYGEAIIRVYYSTGPCLAALIHKFKFLRIVSYFAVVRPASFVANLLLHKKR